MGLDEVSNRKLKFIEVLMHKYWKMKNKKPNSNRPKGWERDDIIDLHVRTVKKMYERSLDHEVKDELDHISFENNDEINLQDVMKNFQDFKIDKPYIWLEGELVEKGSTEGMIDVCFGKKERMNSNLDMILKSRILSMFPEDMQERINFKYCEPKGEDIDKKYINIFNLSLRKEDNSDVERLHELPIKDGDDIIENREEVRKMVM